MVRVDCVIAAINLSGSNGSLPPSFPPSSCLAAPDLATLEISFLLLFKAFGAQRSLSRSNLVPCVVPLILIPFLAPVLACADEEAAYEDKDPDPPPIGRRLRRSLSLA